MTLDLAFREDVVALFPGQGSISSGAGARWRDSTHWDVVAQVSEVAGVDVGYLLLEAPNEELLRTDNAQIATFALSLLGFGELLDVGVRPRYLLGHSLGEFSALVAAGLLTLSDGARLIGARGRAMAAAALTSDGTMVAVMGGDERARANLEQLKDVWIANINGTGQIVLSGRRSALDDVLVRYRELGWRRATALPVGGAFHSPLMASAQSALDEALSHVSWGHTENFLIANVDAQVHTDALSWSQLLSRQLTSPVEFLDATLALPSTVTSSVELPPGSVLTGLTKRIRNFANQWSPSDRTQFQEISQ